MNLTEKSREQIARLTKDFGREQFVDLLYQLATVEPHYSPATIAARNEMDPRTILRDAHEGKFGGRYYKRTRNQMRFAASDVLFWRDNFKVEVNGGNGHG